MEKYLDFSLNSIFSQNLILNKFEVIAIDDGSNDNSLLILQKWVEKYNNIFIYTQKNYGVSSARNIGLKYAKGQYILFLDPDDALLPNTLKYLIDISIKEQCEIVSGKFLKIEDDQFDNNIIFKQNEVKMDKPSRMNIANYFHLCFDSRFPVIWMYLFNKKFLDSYNIFFDSNANYAEDCLFIVNAFLRAKEIINTNITFYAYRLRHNSAVNMIKYSHILSLSHVVYELYLLNKEYEKDDEIKIAINHCIYVQFNLLIWYICHYDNIYTKKNIILEKFDSVPFKPYNFYQFVYTFLYNHFSFLFFILKFLKK